MIPAPFADNSETASSAWNIKSFHDSGYYRDKLGLLNTLGTDITSTYKTADRNK